MANDIHARNVKELADYFTQLVKQGKGDYVVFVTNDEEGNGYHALWYLGEEPTDMEQDTRKFVEDYNSDIYLLKNNRDKAIYMG